MRKSRNGPTVELSFIYLKKMTAGDNNQVKIPMPKKFDMLMKTVVRHFGATMNVKALYTEEGKRIETILDVIPGTVILVADKEITLDLHQAATPTKRHRKNKGHTGAAFTQIFGGTKQPESKFEVIESPAQLANYGFATPSSKKQQSNLQSQDEWVSATEIENGFQRTPQSFFEMNESTPRGSFQSRDISTPGTGNQLKTPQTGFQFQDGTTPRSGIPSRDGRTPQGVFHFKSGKIAGPGVQSRGDKTPQSQAFNSTQDSHIQGDKTPTNGPQKTPQGSLKGRRTPKSAFQLRFERSVESAMSQSPDENIDMTQTPKNRSKSSSKRLRESPLTPKEEVEMEKQSTLEMGDLFSKIVGESNVDAPKMWEAVKHLRKERRESLPMFANMNDLEMTSLCDWMTHGLSTLESIHLPRVTDEYFAYNSLVTKARNVIAQHRKAMPGGTCYHFRIGIVGPPRSGKSSFLSLLGEELMCDLLVTDSFKRTFIMILDCSQLSPLVNDEKQFYHAVVQTTIHCLRWQAPHLRGKLDMLQKFFESVTDVVRYPRFPGSYSNASDDKVCKGRYQKIANDLCDLWRDERRKSGWYMAVSMFPTFLAQAVGFKNVVFLIDHFDEIDVDAPTNGHFSNARDRVALSDIMKLTLQQNNFIVSCRNEQKLYNVLATSEIVPGFFCDATAGIEYITSDIGDECPCQGDKTVFALEIAGQDETLEVYRDDLGNYPAYVRHWKHLISASRKARKCKDYLDEENLLLIDAGQSLVDDVYTSPDWRENIIVDSVRQMNKR